MAIKRILVREMPVEQKPVRDMSGREIAVFRKGPGTEGRMKTKNVTNGPPFINYCRVLNTE